MQILRTQSYCFHCQNHLHCPHCRCLPVVVAVEELVSGPAADFAGSFFDVFQYHITTVVL